MHLDEYDGPTLGELGEDAVLAAVLEAIDRSGAAGRAAEDRVPVPAGDDAAVLATPSGSVVTTTDSMLRGGDWRDDWSRGHEVGQKVVAQNLADIAAMGARPTGLLVALAADPATRLSWVVDLATGIGEAARDAGAVVLGGDLSRAPADVVVIGVTALGDLDGREPVLRSGARPGDVVAVAGSLGWSGGGLALYERGVAPPSLQRDSGDHDKAVATLMWAHQTAGRPPFESGPLAAAAGATSMIDVSDGLVRDLGRVARASGVHVDLDGEALRTGLVDGALEEALGAEEGLRQVLGGGEEHSLVATFAPGDVPDDRRAPWTVIGRVLAGEPTVTLDGAALPTSGWDHFAR